MMVSKIFHLENPIRKRECIRLVGCWMKVRPNKGSGEMDYKNVVLLLDGSQDF